MFDVRARIERALRSLAIAAVVLLLLGAFGGLVVMISGIVPIKASSRHWDVTAALLDFAKRRSVRTHTFRMTVPPLEDPGLALKGAGQYDFACEPCHGSPAVQQPRIAYRMTPTPPDLMRTASRYDPEELFYIVKHGIKFTGMPSWPTQQRDDEVWAMTAFLLELPELDARQYERLVKGDAEQSGSVPPIEDLLPPENVPQAVKETCRRCHGDDGRGGGLGAFPRLAGQKPGYLAAALQAFANGDRHSGIMEPIAAGLSPQEMRNLARYFGGLDAPRALPLAPGNASAVERGAEIARQGIPAQKVAACMHCHGPGDIERNPRYPLLAGQFADYLSLQLELFKNRNRGGSDFAHLMHPVADPLTSEQMSDVALYYASVNPAE